MSLGHDGWEEKRTHLRVAPLRESRCSSFKLTWSGVPGSPGSVLAGGCLDGEVDAAGERTKWLLSFFTSVKARKEVQVKVGGLRG